MTGTAIVPLVLGAAAFASAAVALFFLRFYRDARDPLFLYFAAAFLVEAVNRVLFALSPHPNEGSPTLYLMRAFAYSLILAGILNKNRR